MPCKTQACSGTDSWCQICAPTGSSITFVAIGTVGEVLFASARYDGQELVAGAPVAEVMTTVKPDRSFLTAAYVFSNGPAGRGELHERCTTSKTKKLDDLRGDDGLRRHKICGV